MHQHAGVIERRAAVRAVRSADDAIRQIEPCDTGAADRVVAVVMQPDPGEGRCQSRVQDNPCSRWGRCGVVGPSHVLNLAARTSGLIGIRTGTAVTRHSQTSGRPGWAQNNPVRSAVRRYALERQAARADVGAGDVQGGPGSRRDRVGSARDNERPAGRRREAIARRGVDVEVAPRQREGMTVAGVEGDRGARAGVELLGGIAQSGRTAGVGR